MLLARMCMYEGTCVSVCECVCVWVGIPLCLFAFLLPARMRVLASLLLPLSCVCRHFALTAYECVSLMCVSDVCL